jgi:hypothetical protein
MLVLCIMHTKRVPVRKVHLPPLSCRAAYGGLTRGRKLPGSDSAERRQLAARRDRARVARTVRGSDVTRCICCAGASSAVRMCFVGCPAKRQRDLKAHVCAGKSSVVVRCVCYANALLSTVGARPQICVKA